MRRRYAFLMNGLSLIAPLWLNRRAKVGKEDPARLGERYGKTHMPRPQGELIWMHGASVGETKMMLPLIKRLLSQNPNRYIIVTSGTMTSAELMNKTLPERSFHQYIPLDAPFYIERFLRHWKPNLAVWVESEIWPNLIQQTHNKNIPMALINARMSQKSLSGWEKRHKFAKKVFACFDVILPADSRTAKGLSRLTERTLTPCGNLKYDAPSLTYDISEHAYLKPLFGGKPIWVAASIHSEEINTIIEAQKQIDASLILVPRHPSDAASRMIVADHPNLKFARRSKEETPNAQTDIYLFDTLGEMGLAYALSDLALVGGSLSPELMGHNPLEPIRLNIPTLTGPHFTSFSDVYAPYIKENAILCIEDTSLLPQIIRDMLSTPDRLNAMSQRATEIAERTAGSLDVTTQALENLLVEKSV